MVCYNDIKWRKGVYNMNTMNKKEVITCEGLYKFENELTDLKVNKRKEIAEKIKEAREWGDLLRTRNMMLLKMNKEILQELTNLKASLRM